MTTLKYPATIKYYPEARDGLPIDITGGIRPGTKKDSIKWIIIHETGNPSANAGADAHLAYLKNLTIANKNIYNSNIKNGQYPYNGLYWISFNYVVQGNIKGAADTGKTYNLIPDGEVAWTNSDGRTAGGGNMAGISIEICDSVTYDMEDGYQRAIELVASLMKKYNLTRDNIKAHQDFAPDKKMCPYQLLRDNRWEWFKDKCVAKYDELYNSPEEDPKFIEGANVFVSGTLYSTDDMGKPSIDTVKNERMVITKVSDKGTTPYEVTKKGFVSVDNLTYIKPNPPTGGVEEEVEPITVGELVKVTGSIYSSAWKKGPTVQVYDKLMTVRSIIKDGNPSAPYQVDYVGFVPESSIKRL